MIEQEQEVMPQQEQHPGLIVRASECAKMMTKSRTKSNPIGETTLTWLKQKAVEYVMGYRPRIDNKYLDKGIECEDTSIKLLNDVLGTDYVKHDGRINTEGFTGECDILTNDHVRDIKTSWSLETFPWFKDDALKAARKSGYEWQVRMYMLLYGVDVAYIDYCLVDTPLHLINEWDDEGIHLVSHIEKSKRVTTVRFDRDENKEQELIEKYKVCNEKFQEYVKELNLK